MFFHGKLTLSRGSESTVNCRAPIHMYDTIICIEEEEPTSTRDKASQEEENIPRDEHGDGIYIPLFQLCILVNNEDVFLQIPWNIP